MTRTLLLAILVSAAAGCAAAVDAGDERDQLVGDGAGAQLLRLEPASARLDIVDGVAQLQAYRVLLREPDGAEIDVTDRATLRLADARFGRFAATTLRVAGEGAGRTQVLADVAGITATSALEVHVRATEYGVGVPDDAAGMFARAITGTNCGTKLAYPADGTIVPANLGRLDVHWIATTSDVFEVRITNDFVERVIYTRAPGAAIEGAAWQPFATSRDRAELRLAGMQAHSTLTKCVDMPRTVRLTDTDVAGGVYYSADGALVRHDLAAGGVAQPVFTGADRPAACIGCHALSRDGARMAMTLDGATGRGAVFDLVEGRAMPMGDARWSAATFTPDGEQLLATDAGTLTLLDVASGAVIRTFPTGHVTGQPELSPDGTQLVTVEAPAGADWQFAAAQVVIRTFRAPTFETPAQIGEARVLLPFDAATGVQSYYPSWSPDGKWIAVTRAASPTSYATAQSNIFVVAADGSRGPYAITTSRESDAWATWLPFASSVDGEPAFFLSFTSRRPFGTQLAAGHEQLWLAPFFPARAGDDARPVTAPAFRAPWQDLTTENHNAQWAANLVTPAGVIY